MRYAAFCFTAWAIGGLAVAADRANTPAQKRAVDMAALAGGQRIFGMLAAPPSDDKVVFLVQRQWLQTHQGELYRAATAGEDDRRKQAWKELRQRLLAWRERRTEPKVFVDFLERSLREAESQLASQEKAAEPTEPSQLLMLELPKAKVRNSYLQPPEMRRLLGLAWQERLENTEDLSAAEITEKLKARGVDVERAQPDLSDRLDVQPQTDRQWAAKVAVVEFEILGEPHYQGTGGVLVRAGNDQHRAKVGDLVGELLQDQLGGALGDLLNGAGGAARVSPDDRHREATEKALASASADGFRGVRVSYLDQELANRRVTVDDRFFARMPDDSWQAIWRQSATLDATQASKEEDERLAADPQVAEILKSVKGLGLDANQDLFKTALRFGAVTQQAMWATDREMAQFLLKNTRRLIGPPMFVP